MKLMHRFIGSAITLILVGCGGGGGSSSGSSSSPPAPSPQLPAPILFVQGTSTFVQIPDADSACSYKMYVNDGTATTSVSLGAQSTYTSPVNNTTTSYSYTCTKNGHETPQSRMISLQNFTLVDYGYWGALSFDDFNKDGIYELLGTLSTPSGTLTTVSEESLGLSDLRRCVKIGQDETCRIYRDIRFADLDNDGNLDAIANVYSENNPYDPNYNSYVQLYWGTTDGKFVLDQNFENKHYTGYGETIVVADLDNDGYLDFFVPQYKINGSSNPYSRNLLFKNQKNKTFLEVGLTSGVSVSIQGRPEGAQALDFNEDGFVDLYAGGSLFLNNHDFTFNDIAVRSGLPGAFDEGSKFFDYDLDGDLDLIINTSFSKPRLFLNDNGHFTEASPGVFPNEYYETIFGMELGDFNNDGYDDLLLAGGYNEQLRNLAPRLYLNINGMFVRQKISDDFLGWSDLVGFSDLNNDGALDLVFRYGNMRRILNSNIPNAYVKLNVFGGGKRNQQGRRVDVRYPNGKVKAMVVNGGAGYMSNQPYELLIPNDGQSLLEITIKCHNKKIVLNAVNGAISSDCD